MIFGEAIRPLWHKSYACYNVPTMPWWKPKKRLYSDIAPDEIFLDAANLPDFDQNQFEGRIEKPITLRVVTIFSSMIILIICAL